MSQDRKTKPGALLAGVAAGALTSDLPAGTGMVPRPPRPTHQRVRANSRYRGELPPAPISRREAGRRKAALRIRARDLRRPGKRAGAKGTISHYMCAIYDVIVDQVRRTGLAELAVGTIAALANCSERTVYRAKRMLHDQGWLDWINQCEPTGARGVRGPQVKQIANRYLLKLPAWGEALIARWRATDGPPGSEDLEHERARRDAWIAEAEEADRELKRREWAAASPAIAAAEAKARRMLAAAGDGPS